MKPYLPLLLFLLSFPCAAQKDFRSGYIVDLKGDTTRGLVNHSTRSIRYRECYFKSQSHAEPVRFRPNELLGYGFQNDKAFVAMELSVNEQPKEFIFLERLVTGRVSLFKLDHFFVAQKENERHILQKQVHTVVDQNVNYAHDNRKYIGLLNVIMGDCRTSISDMSAETKFTQKSLVDLTVDYNKCVNSTFVVEANKRPASSINIYPIIGYGSSTFSFTSSLYTYLVEKRSYMTGRSPAFGLGVQFGSPRTTENIFGTVELIYSKTIYSGSGFKGDQFTSMKEDNKITYSRLRVPIGIKYVFGTASWSPYARAGASLNFLTGGRLEIDNTKTIYQSGAQTITHIDERLDPFKFFQLWLSIGTQKRIGKLKYFLEVRYEPTVAVVNSVVQIEGTAQNVMDGKTLQTTTLNGYFGILF